MYETDVFYEDDLKVIKEFYLPKEENKKSVTTETQLKAKFKTQGKCVPTIAEKKEPIKIRWSQILISISTKC